MAATVSLAKEKRELKASSLYSARIADTISVSLLQSIPRIVDSLAPIHQIKTLTTTDGERDRPYLTVKPLADSLGVPFDYSIARDDADKVAQTVKDFNGAGNILICWEHGQLTRIAEALGVKGDAKYPGDRY